MRAFLIVSVSTLMAGSALSPGHANPGGGGGGGGSAPRPSMSAPDFNPADEYRKGIEALKASRYADAKKSLKRVLEVAPRDANANFLAGLADAGLNDLKAAQKHYEQAVRADGKLIPARQELAVTYAKLGNRPKAEAQLGELKKLAGTCGATCPQADQLKTAVAAVESALAQGPQARLETQPPLLFASAAAGDQAYLDAVALINEGRFEAAIDSLHKARTSFGAHPDVLTYLGFANRKLKRFEVAESYYRQALTVAPAHKGATEYYGELMVERGDLVGARTMLAKLDRDCAFGCAEADELRRWIDARHAPGS